MSPSRLRLAVLLTLIPLLLPARARAESAEAVTKRALDLRAAGKSAEALQLFEQALSLAPSPHTLGNLGLTEASLEHWVPAADHLAAALAAPDDPWTRKNQRGLEKALALVRAHVAELSITGPPGVDVSINGALIGTLPLAHTVRVSQGTVILKATARGYQPFEKTLAVSGGDTLPVALALDKAPLPPPLSLPLTTGPATPIVPLSGTPIASPRSWKTWTGGGLLLGGAALVAWGITWIAIDGSHHGAPYPSSSCPGITSTGTCASVYDTRAPGLVLTGAGIAAGIAGGILLRLDRHPRSEVTIIFNPSGAFTLASRF